MFNCPAPKRRSSGSTKLPLFVRCHGSARFANGAVVAPERSAALIVSARPAAAASAGLGLPAAVSTSRVAAADTTGVAKLVKSWGTTMSGFDRPAPSAVVGPALLLPLVSPTAIEL